MEGSGADRNVLDDQDVGPAFVDGEDILEEYDLGEAPPDENDEDEPSADSNDMSADGEGRADEDVVDMSAVRFTSHADYVYCVAIHPTGQHIACSGGGDDKAYLWSTDDGAILHTLAGHTDTIISVGFNHDGRFVATGGYDGFVKVWDVVTGRLLRTLEGPTEQVEWVTWHTKGNVIAAGSADGTAWMWLADTGACMQVFAGHEGSVTCGTFTGSGKMLITGSEDCTVRIWNPKTGACAHVFQGHGMHEGPITCLVAHPTEPLLLTGAQDGTGRLLKLDARKVIGAMNHAGLAAGSATGRAAREDEDVETFSVESVGFCMTNPWLATGGVDGNVRLWDTSSMQCRLVLSHDGSTVTRLRWHPSKPLLYTSCADGALREWDGRSGQCVRVLTGHTNMLQDFDFRFSEADGEVLVSASDDGTCRLFRL